MHDAIPGSVNGKLYDAAYNPEVMRWVTAATPVVLDVGCGSGGNAAYLARHGAAVDGVTLSPAEAQSAQRWCRAVSLFDLEQGLPPELSGPYDVIVCSHILEHVCFPQRLLQDILARLSPGGRLIAAVPNLLYLKNRLQLLLGRFEYERGGVMDETHFRWYTLSSLTRLLQSHGFVIERAYGAGNVPLGPLRSMAPAACSALDALACRLRPGLFGWQLLAIATPG